MPGRSFTAGTGYRYGFNGQEKVDEIQTLNSFVSFRFRGEDVRFCRFISIDPLLKLYPMNSPYSFAENRVIDGNELEGLEYHSAADFAKSMIGFNYSERDPYTFRTYASSKINLKNEVSCYESAVYSYAQANGIVSDYLNKNKFPVNRDPSISWFKNGGENHSFIDANEFKDAKRGDILFQGKPTPKEGHAAIVNGTPVLSEDGKTFTIPVLTTNGAPGHKYSETTYTFTKYDEGWLQSGNSNNGGDGAGSFQKLTGFGRVDEDIIVDKSKPIEMVKTINVFDRITVTDE